MIKTDNLSDWKIILEWHPQLCATAEMRIYVPHTEIQTITGSLLSQYPWTGVQLEGVTDYGDYLQERWDEELPFINIEHDVVWWDGAIEEIWGCEEPWCVYNYDRNDIVDGAPLGLAKISTKLIKNLPGIWDSLRNEPNIRKDAGCPEWGYCDQWLFEEAKKKKIYPHQHKPGIINANPKFFQKGRHTMHPQAHNYVQKTVQKFGPFHSIVDLGGREINGTPKDLFPDALTYFTVDISDGPGVHAVADAADWVPDTTQKFDCVISTELLEHTHRGEEIIHNAARILRGGGGGRLILTTASSPRSPHSATGESQLAWDEYYSNHEPPTLTHWLTEAGFKDIEVEKHVYQDHGGDLYATARI